MTDDSILLERYLGIPVPERALRPQPDEHEKRPVQTIYEWFEWGFRPPPSESRQPELEIMRRLPEHGIVLILGVPGAGKSTLARQWFERLETEEYARPVLFGECGLLRTVKENQNILLEILGRNPDKQSRAILAQVRADQTPPRTVMIVDALDELPSRFDVRDQFIPAIREASEHALVVLTCRTHVWGDALERVFKLEQVQINQKYTLLGFTPNEQREYLTRWAEQNKTSKQDAETLAKNLFIQHAL